MGIQDRDWYRDAHRERQPYRSRADRPISRRTLALAALGGIATGILADMLLRGVPLTLQGLKWWLSLWMPT